MQIIKCARCGQSKEADHRDRHLCVDCVKAENNRYNYLRMNQGDWIAAAKDAEIDVWLQQPGETQWEYTVWCAFRDAYPGKKPTYGDVAAQLGTTMGVVRKIAQRWTFQARLQAWIAECSRITMEQRRREILDMNADHISMAKRLRDKLSTAIDAIDPYELKPSELTSLMKMTTDLERRAQIDAQSQEALVAESCTADDENPDIKKSPTKQSDLSEVVNILLKAGALGTVTQIGVRETTTREVVAKSGDDEVTLVQEE